MAIIKCPECGHAVTERAPFCPGCGIRIANNVKKCPDCGHVAIAAAEACPQCGHQFNTPDGAEPAPASRPQPEAEEEIIGCTHPASPPERKKRHTALIVTTLVIIVCIIGGTAAYLYVRSAKAEETMEAAARLLDGSLDPDDYQAFLDAYPAFPRRNELETRMQKLRAENTAWASIAASNSKNDFIQFLNRFPHSRYELLCHQKIDSLDWLDVMRTNTPDAVRRYLAEHPDGNYAAEARKMADDLQVLAVRPRELAMVAHTCRAFFAALSAGDRETVDRLSTSDVAAAMTGAHAVDAPTPHFTVNNDFVVTKRSASPDSIAFHVTYTVTRRPDSGDKTAPSAPSRVLMEIDPQMKIHSVRLEDTPAPGA